MNNPVWNSSKLNENPFTSPAKHTLLSSAFLLCSGLLLMLLLAASIYFLQKPALYFVLIGFCFVFLLLMAHRGRKISYGLKRFNAVLNSSSNPIHITDGNGVTRYANPAFLQWSGMNQSSVIGQNLFDLMKITTYTGSKENVWSLAKLDLLSDKIWKGEVEFARADGQLAIADLILSPVLNSNGKLLECIALHKDLVERKELTRKMVETQRQYRSIVESSLDGIMIVQNERLVYVNPSAVSIFGYASAEEMQSLNFSETIAQPSKPFLAMTPDGRGIGEEVLRNYELRGLTKQGKIIDLEANAHVIAWNDYPAVQASFRNITERKMLEREQTLWLWEQETLSDIDRKLVGVVDLQKIFAAILQHTLNLTRAHFDGVLLFDEPYMQWISICGNTLQHSEEMFSPSETLLDIVKNEEPLIIHNSSTNTQYPLSQLSIVGEEKLISTAWLPLIVEGKHRGMLVVGYRQYHDFAGREMRLLISLAEKHSIAMVNAQLYTDLLQREKELEILSGARVQAQEDERRRIAREIHDGLGQMLTAIKFNLEILEDMITAGKDERERIDDMKNLLDSVMKEAREISYNLMPSVLDDFGLVPALQLLSEQFANRTNVKVQFQAHGVTNRLDPNMEIGLYRIAQESLNNISKHAEATEVNLQIINHSNGIRLVIEDNGKG
ncbi:MAG: PAS domain S-box protein, partial [Bacteroidota bacterium]